MFLRTRNLIQPLGDMELHPVIGVVQILLECRVGIEVIICFIVRDIACFEYQCIIVVDQCIVGHGHGASRKYLTETISEVAAGRLYPREVVRVTGIYLHEGIFVILNRIRPRGYFLLQLVKVDNTVHSNRSPRSAIGIRNSCPVAVRTCNPAVQTDGNIVHAAHKTALTILEAIKLELGCRYIDIGAIVYSKVAATSILILNIGSSRRCRDKLYALTVLYKIILASQGTISATCPAAGWAFVYSVGNISTVGLCIVCIRVENGYIGECNRTVCCRAFLHGGIAVLQLNLESGLCKWDAIKPFANLHIAIQRHVVERELFARLVSPDFFFDKSHTVCAHIGNIDISIISIQRVVYFCGMLIVRIKEPCRNTTFSEVVGARSQAFSAGFVGLINNDRISFFIKIRCISVISFLTSTNINLEFGVAYFCVFRSRIKLIDSDRRMDLVNNNILLYRRVLSCSE